MASYYQFTSQLAAISHNHGSGRSRRVSRLSVSNNGHRQFRGARSMKDLNESAALSVFRLKFEAGRSFELEDDIEFCPNLLTETDVSTDAGLMVSLSSASERSSLASNSPDSSPTQQPQTVASNFSFAAASSNFVMPALQGQQSNLKLHQPSATRGRNAIPIVNPATGVSMSSPPPSVSPAGTQQSLNRRW